MRAKAVRPMIGLGALVLIVAEIAGVVWVASAIGWWTVALMLASTALGLYLLQREWRKEWDSLVRAVTSGEIPAGQMADATLVLLGGVLLVMPGFLSDIVGLVLLLPFTRPFVRAFVAWGLARFIGRRSGSSTVIKGEATLVEPAGIENAAEGTTIRSVVEE